MPAGLAGYGVVRTPAPARLVWGGLPAEATVAQVLLSKYGDRRPLSPGQIYARQGIDLDRSTLADRASEWAIHSPKSRKGPES
jgi:transposase